MYLIFWNPKSDLYQMWAYVGKYKKQSCRNKAESSQEKNVQPNIKVILIYPQCEATKDLQYEWQNMAI